MTNEEPLVNYASVEEAPELAAAEIDRFVANKFAVHYASWDEVVQEFGKSLVSKIARIVKVRDDGTLKVRNVLDLRRSGFNAHV